ncbi:MAG: biotin--[acetyl-CoA-carboxylase] ligase [Campylobacter sp.]|nr:biotin--[acetyl-CoA-carboxylase] ligase [Campylobacter sp.]
MLVEFVDSCPSTHLYLTDALRKGVIKPPYAICAKNQTQGVGSRGNEWNGYEGNLFLSFCVDKNFLPNDLNEASISIYFSMIMKIYLQNLGSNLWVKWPNDFYLNELKIGGTISTKVQNFYVGSIGLNLLKAPENAGVLDISIQANDLVWGFCELLEKKISWKEILSKFSVEFDKSKNFITHINNESVDLSEAVLCEDGAILINKKKVYSLR